MAERKGRDFRIDYILAGDYIMGEQNILWQDLNRYTQAQGANIDGFITYINGMSKGDLTMYLEDIHFHPELAQVGIFYRLSHPVPFDFHNNDGNVAIARNAQALELVIPKMRFTPNAPQVTSLMATRSLELVAMALERTIPLHAIPPPSHIFGLTHPTMARAATRWGFEVSTHPFPPEIYALIETSAKQERVKAPADLALLREQHLVYQTTAQFLSRFAQGGQITS